MKKIIKKNQLIITALAALIAVAGYLNHAEKKLADEAKLAGTSEQKTEQETTDTRKPESGDKEGNNNKEGNNDKEDSNSNVSDNGDKESNVDVSQKDDIQSNDIEVEGTPGEAIFVNASGTVDFIVEAKLAKEYSRVSAKEALQVAIDSKTLSSEEKRAAVEKLVELTEVSEREMAAENLIMAKGYSDVAVTMTDGYVDVIIVAEKLNSSERAKIEDIVKRKLQVAADKITINAIEVKKNK